MAISIGGLKAFLRLDDDFSGKLDLALRKLESTGKKMEAVGRRMSATGTKLTVGLTLPIVAVGGAAVKMAIDAVEAENLFSVSFGSMEEAARKWSEETGKALGLNRVELRKQSGVIFTMVESMGLARDAAFEMATGITELSGDMASFFNLRPEEAFEKLRSGIVGETEPLRQLGILVDEQTVKTAAYTAGIAKWGAELTQQEKVQARWIAIQQQTIKVQGDLARTLDSPANRLRALKTRMEEAAISIGTKLLPAFERALSLAEKLATKFENLSPAGQTAALATAAVAAAAGPLLIILGNLITVAGSAAGALTALGNSAFIASGKLKLLAVWTGRLLLPLTALVTIWNSISSNQARAQESLARLREEYESGALTVEDLRERLKKLDFKIVRGKETQAEIRALKMLLEELGEETGEAGEGMASFSDTITVTATALPVVGDATEEVTGKFRSLSDVLDSIGRIENIFSFVPSAAEQLVTAALDRWQRFIGEAGRTADFSALADRLEEAYLESWERFKDSLASGPPVRVKVEFDEPSKAQKFGRAFSVTFAEGLQGVGQRMGDSAVQAILQGEAGLKNLFRELGQVLVAELSGIGFDSLTKGIGNAFGTGAGASAGVAAFAVVFAAAAYSAISGAWRKGAVTIGFQGVIDSFSSAITVFKNSVLTFEGAALILAEAQRAIRSSLNSLFGPIGGFRFDLAAASVAQFPSGGLGPGGGAGGGGGGRSAIDFGEMLRIRLTGILNGVFDSFPIFVQQRGEEWIVAIQNIVTGFGDSLESATQDMLDRFARILPSLIESGAIVFEGIPKALVEVLKKSGAQTFEELKAAMEVAAKVYVKSLGVVAGTLFTNLNTMISEVQEAIRVGLPLDVAKQAVLNSLNEFKNAVAGVQLFPAFASKRKILKQFREALERLGIVGTEAKQQLQEMANSVRIFNMSVRANVLGQLADLARRFGVSAEVIKQVELLRVRLQFLTLKMQLKAAGLWERYAALWQRLFRMAKQEARRAGAQFQHGSAGLRDFGSGTLATLHGHEEVLTQKQGEGVAAMVHRAVQPAGGGDWPERLIGRIDHLALALMRQQSLAVAGLESARAKGLM